MGRHVDVTLDLTKLNAAIRQYPGRLDAWLRSIAIDVANEAKLSFNTGPGGRTYRRGRKLHIASSPNYPPNVDTGTLRASIRMTKMGPNHYRVQDGVDYGIWLEDGVPGRMQPRPFLQPAIRTKKRAFQKGEGLDLE